MQDTFCVVRCTIQNYLHGEFSALHHMFRRSFCFSELMKRVHLSNNAGALFYGTYLNYKFEE